MPKLQFIRLNSNVFTPTRNSKKSAGLDLQTYYDINVPAESRLLVDIGIKIKLPEGCYGRIASRSGLATKKCIDIGAGVIDEDYRGPIKVLLINTSKSEVLFKKGDRIAQLICEKIMYPEIEEVQSLPSTERGTQGFGSTETSHSS